MSTPEQNKAIIMKIYDNYGASKGQDTIDLFDVLADDCLWRSPGSDLQFAFATEGRGPDYIRQLFETLYEEWEQVHYTPAEFIAEGDRVVMLGACGFRNKKTGKVLETNKADFFKLKDGKIVEFQEFWDTLKAADAEGHAVR